MVAMYLFGQLVVMTASRVSIGLETVVLGTLDSLEEHQGLAVRDEYIATTTEGGKVKYSYAEGDKIPKNAVVAIIQDENTTDPIEEKILQIDQDILKSQKNRSDLSLFAEDIARIDQSIQQTITQNINRFMSESMESVYDVKSRVQVYMNQRNEIWFTEDIGNVSQLTNQKFQYETQLAENIISITAEESGVLSFAYDGLEESLTVENLDSITEAQIGNVTINNIDTDQILNEGDEVFKIVTDDVWYIVSYLPNAIVSNWRENGLREITLKNGNDKVAVNCTIKTIDTGENVSRVVFSTNEYINTFMNSRNITFYPEINISEGLKIPKSAVVEKSLIAIPKTAVSLEGREYGVTLKTSDDGDGKFVAMTVGTSDDLYNYLNPSDSLSVGDIIWNGSEEYIVPEALPVAGVYSANSSVAKFAHIEIIEQNQEYIIAKYGNNYGLQPYDVIVSDAKNIVEGQELY